MASETEKGRGKKRWSDLLQETPLIPKCLELLQPPSPKNRSLESPLKGWALGDAWKAGSVPANTRWWGPQCF